MKNYVKFTVEIHDEDFPDMDRVLVWEKPNSNVTLSDINECIRTLMYGLMFSEKSINKMFLDYVLENGLIEESKDKVTES